VVSSAQAIRASTAIAACNGTHAEILCDANGGAGQVAAHTYLKASPIAVSSLRTIGPYKVRDLTFSGAHFPSNGLRRKVFTISGPGATTGRVYSNTANVISIIDQGTSVGAASVVTVQDDLGGGGMEAHVILLDLAARGAPFPNRPSGWKPGQDPVNACTFKFLLGGNGGLSGAGLLVEPQTAGGNNRYSGLFEGFFDTNGRYQRQYGAAKYCMKILTSSGFSIVDAHFEGAGNGKDPNLIVAGGCGNFEIGPNVLVDQKLLIQDSKHFRINGGIYTAIERAGSTANYGIAESAYVGKLI
jgi:hypothetical protein